MKRPHSALPSQQPRFGLGASNASKLHPALAASGKRFKPNIQRSTNNQLLLSNKENAPNTLKIAPASATHRPIGSRVGQLLKKPSQPTFDLKKIANKV